MAGRELSHTIPCSPPPHPSGFLVCVWGGGGGGGGEGGGMGGLYNVQGTRAHWADREHNTHT